MRTHYFVKVSFQIPVRYSAEKTGRPRTSRSLAFACVFKSRFPEEAVATRGGSLLLVGIKTTTRLIKFALGEKDILLVKKGKEELEKRLREASKDKESFLPQNI